MILAIIFLSLVSVHCDDTHLRSLDIRQILLTQWTLCLSQAARYLFPAKTIGYSQFWFFCLNYTLFFQFRLLNNCIRTSGQGTKYIPWRKWYGTSWIWIDGRCNGSYDLALNKLIDLEGRMDINFWDDIDPTRNRLVVDLSEGVGI